MKHPIRKIVHLMGVFSILIFFFIASTHYVMWDVSNGDMPFYEKFLNGTTMHFVAGSVAILLSSSLLSYLIWRYIGARESMIQHYQTNRKRYEETLDHSMSGIINVNEKLEIVKCNQVAKDKFFGDNEICKKGLGDLLGKNITLLGTILEDGKEVFVDEIKINNSDMEKQYVSMKVVRSSTGITIYTYDLNYLKAKIKSVELNLKKIESIIKYANDAIITTDSSGFIVGWNDGAVRMFGYEMDEALGLHISIIVDPAKKKEHFLAFNHATKNRELKEHYHFDLKGSKRDGTLFSISLTLSMWETAERELYVTAIIRDISLSEELYSNVSTAFREKQTLLMELQHRVKNTLQSIIAIVNIEGHKSDSESVKTFVEILRSRLHSIESVYSSLNFEGEEFSIEKVSINSFLKPLIDRIESIHSDVRGIEFDMKFSKMTFSLKEATNIGLIVNEIITNSFKHAFDDKKDGRKIFLRFKKKKDRCEISIGDNGSGLPIYSETDKTKTSGLKLIDLLLIDIDAEMSVNTENGTLYNIIIPINTDK